jgi:hypothetical protein
VDPAAAPEPTDALTVREGFDAMRLFLETVWFRHGGTPEDIAFIIGGARWVDGSPADVSIWQDWLFAVGLCKRNVEANIKADLIISTSR